MGNTGEYDDASEWPVKAFHREIDCQEMVKAMNEYLKEKTQDFTPHDVYFAPTTPGSKDPAAGIRAEIELHMREHYDPLFHMDYNGTEYKYIEIPAKLRG
jgi:hypothetical protein